MGLNNIEVKRLNRNNLLRYMLKSEQISKRSAAAALNLSIPTVTQCLNDLVEMGLARETGSLKSIGGRKSIGYCSIKDAKTAIGVDITRNHVNIVAIDLAMNLLYFKRSALKIHDTPQSYEKLKNLIVSSIEESGVDSSSILGLGISLPAILDEKGRRFITKHEELDVSYHLYDIISSWFSYPVYMQNDANSAGKAEISRQGLTENTVYYYFGPSVGGAIIIEGKLIHGTHRRAGEFGHMTLVPGGKKCYCGRSGCVNAYCSTNILAECAQDNLETFFSRLESQDIHCREVWESYLDSLALAVHNTLSSFDMKVIIGGYLGPHMRPYMGALEERIRKIDPYLSDISFVIPAKLKYEASAMGVAEVFVEQYLSEI